MMIFVWEISRPPCEWCKFGQVFKLGDWKTAESGPMLNFFGQNHLKFYLNGAHFYEKYSGDLVPKIPTLVQI